MSDCIFCKIVNGEIPSHKVYEDEEVLAFLDINPVSYGHLLVIPKKHYETVMDCPDDIYGSLYSKVAKIAKGLLKSLGCNGINILQNNGKISGQVIFHVHVHLIPRKENDRVFPYPKAMGLEVDFEKLVNTIKNELN